MVRFIMRRLRNRLRELFEADTLAHGIVAKMTDSTVVELIALSGFDFVFFDLEHTPIGLETLQNHIRAAMAHGLGTLVRTPDADPAFILRILDMGAEGLLVPGVRSQPEVAEVVSASRFPPLGRRGVSGGTRAADYGMRGATPFGAHGAGTMSEVTEAINRELVVGVMIEETEAVGDIDAIVATPGLDFVFIGPVDLSASMGHIGTSDHPDVRRAVEKVIAACGHRPLPFITVAGHPSMPYTPAELRERSAAMLVHGVDTGVLLAGLRTIARDLKEA
jgi:4-hydroxy-2-oxoheptanedioate aldolase